MDVSIISGAGSCAIVHSRSRFLHRYFGRRNESENSYLSTTRGHEQKGSPAEHEVRDAGEIGYRERVTAARSCLRDSQASRQGQTVLRYLLPWHTGGRGPCPR